MRHGDYNWPEETHQMVSQENLQRHHHQYKERHQQHEEHYHQQQEHWMKHPDPLYELML